MSINNVKYGFYASNNHDRVYSNIDFAKVYSAIIEDGVFSKIGDHFAVTPSSGLTVRVGTGMAWFNNTWTLLEEYGYLTLDAAHNTLSRIDAIVINVNSSSRTNSIDIVKGTDSANPSNPTLTTTQHPLAFIKVNPGVTTLTAADITQAVPETTPYVTGPLKTIMVPEFFEQMTSQFQQWFSGIQATFDGADFASMQAQLDTKVPSSRTINGHALSSNISITASDVGALSTSSSSMKNTFTVQVESDSNLDFDSGGFGTAYLGVDKDGYYPLGIVGYSIENAAGGRGRTWMSMYEYHITNRVGNRADIGYSLKNNGDSSAKIYVKFWVLYMKV